MKKKKLACGIPILLEERESRDKLHFGKPYICERVSGRARPDSLSPENENQIFEAVSANVCAPGYMCML